MRKKTKRKRRVICSILFSAILIIFFFILMENAMLPSLKEIAHIHCKTTANDIIDHVVLQLTESMEPETLILQKNDSYTANTAAINSFCAVLSSEITAELKNLPTESFLIPLGAVTDLSLLANKGPDIPFTLIPMGSASVNYASTFTSVGINQVNYKIWINISIEIKIVNPLYQETLLLKRKIMLADLVYSGKVPQQYFQMTYPDIY